MPDTITDFHQAGPAARLRAGVGLPDKLTLTALSEHYRVSLTPVRLAVRELMDEQVLLKQPNGRMTVNPAAPACEKGDTLPTRPDVAQDVEQTLTAEIIRRSLYGAGEYLREEATAERFGIGRTVLRQVLNRLAGQGLIEHLPRRGWRVRPFDEAEMIAYLQVAQGLELKALDLARPHLDPADLRRMLHGNETSPRQRPAPLPDREGRQSLHPRFLRAPRHLLRHPVRLRRTGDERRQRDGPAASRILRALLARLEGGPQGAGPAHSRRTACRATSAPEDRPTEGGQFMTTSSMQRISVIDSHTGGEPTRVVIAGGPDLGRGSVAERQAVFRERFDWFRSAVVNEPRGSDVMVGAPALRAGRSAPARPA